jgi:pimeloyl-ACP methyl ester carboxylesterase
MGKFSTVKGRYVYVKVEDVEYKVYFEENGQGIPLVCQHTAGSDNRQWRDLLEDENITKDFRVIAYDLPRHGKSDPPHAVEWWKEEYKLTTQWFVQFVRNFCEALELENPVFMGSSFGGNAALQLALEYPDYFRATIPVEGADYTPGYFIDWWNHPHTHGGEVCASGTWGLMAPQSPEKDRRLTWWYYSQGAPGVFKGDLYFYSVDHDLRGKLHLIDAEKCPVYFMTGEYDYLSTPADSKRTADQIPGAKFVEMKEIGHFPMSENHEVFVKYLEEVLQDIIVREKALVVK